MKLKNMDTSRQITGKRSSLSRPAEGLRISTYLHVVESEDKAGFVTGKVLEGQASATRLREKDLALRQGNYDELNIYFETGLMTTEGSVIGICGFPVEYPVNTGINGTSWAIYDSCHVSPETMPGGPGPGLDTIHNYMDYSSHDCINEFTPLQEERMYRSFKTLRKGRRFPQT
ncbi:Uncharacterized protein HZ326_24256 [Fusarium oxysporum f. sp. albedinis]|nr:Uncharacterized protein HZ326_24256 [Fusarium oxysporum f. sp. albedinis]